MNTSLILSFPMTRGRLLPWVAASVTALILNVVSPGTAQAQLLLNVQLNGNGGPASQQTGAGAIGTAGDFWNNVAVTTPSPNTLSQSSGFVMSDGLTASPVTLALSNFSLTGVGSNSGNPGDMLLRYYVGNDSFANPGPSLVTIGGLNPGDTYNLYVYSTADHQGVGGSFSVNGSANQTTWANNDYTAPTPAFTQGNPGDYVVFNSVVVNGSGQIIISASPSNEPQYLVVNGFQLEAVPEPAAGVAVLFGLGLLAFRRVGARSRFAA